jgi:hypothetical protein
MDTTAAGRGCRNAKAATKEAAIHTNHFSPRNTRNTQRGKAATQQAFNPPQINIKKGLTGQADFADYPARQSRNQTSFLSTDYADYADS